MTLLDITARERYPEFQICQARRSPVPAARASTRATTRATRRHSAQTVIWARPVRRDSRRAIHRAGQRAAEDGATGLLRPAQPQQSTASAQGRQPKQRCLHRGRRPQQAQSAQARAQHHGAGWGAEGGLGPWHGRPRPRPQFGDARPGPSRDTRPASAPVSDGADPARSAASANTAATTSNLLAAHDGRQHGLAGRSDAQPGGARPGRRAALVLLGYPPERSPRVCTPAALK